MPPLTAPTLLVEEGLGLLLAVATITPVLSRCRLRSVDLGMSRSAPGGGLGGISTTG